MDMNNWLKAMAVIAAAVYWVLSAVHKAIEIKTLLATKQSIDPTSSNILTRNWPMLLLCTLGLAGMLSIAAGPLSQSSVLFCVIGGVFTGVALATIFVLEIVRMSSKYFWDALDLQAQRQHDLSHRMVSVLEARHLPAQRATDTPLS